MISPRSAKVLQNQIQRSGRSLLQYTTESFPYTSSSRDSEVVKKFTEMAEEETKQNAALATFLRANRYAAPHFGAYPMHFTTMNYLGIDRLLVLIAEHQTEDIKHLEAAIQEVKESEAKAPLRNALAAKQAHLKAIEELIAVRVTAE
ncbi:MAG: hypothetical protein ACFCD0_02610 [Gemmataceae bacterium]